MYPADEPPQYGFTFNIIHEPFKKSVSRDGMRTSLDADACQSGEFSKHAAKVSGFCHNILVARSGWSLRAAPQDYGAVLGAVRLVSVLAGTCRIGGAHLQFTYNLPRPTPAAVTLAKPGIRRIRPRLWVGRMRYTNSRVIPSPSGISRPKQKLYRSHHNVPHCPTSEFSVRTDA